MNIQRFSRSWAGRELIIEMGRFAQQAHGSCTVQYGDTMVLATAVMSENRKEDMDFFPLSVEYEERLYAAGKISGSRFIKREGRPSEDAILAARQVDRSIRPLFDQTIRNEVQVMVTILSFDGENDPNVAAMIATSIALMTSDIPWAGPLAGIRVGKIGSEYIINPTYKQREESTLDVFVANNGTRVTMIEAGAKETPEQQMIDAINFATKESALVLELMEEVHRAMNVTKRDTKPDESKLPEEVRALRVARRDVIAKAQAFVHDAIDTYLFNSPKGSKLERRAAFTALAEKLDAHLESLGIELPLRTYAKAQVKHFVEAEVTRAILEDGVRVDGRGFEDIRQLNIEVGLLPRTHGSGHFMRGETQVLSVVTLGAPGDVQTLDSMESEGTKRYMHHYNFPPYSVGEVKPVRGPGRREIGHGALAERALECMIPSKEEFPYTIRVVSEVLGSNGSSSMASTCGSTLALMDAGVPIKKPVAGIAMGLASDEHGNWKVITDLQDLEDGEGGMDFKITGTRDGITAIQMDTKTSGITREIIEQTFHQASRARIQILDQIAAVIAAPRAELSKYAPRIETITIDPEKIREVIGPGGKVINNIIALTGVQIDIEQDGRVMITSDDADGMARAVAMVQDIVREVEPGETFTGKVVRLEDFGAFVNVLPGKDGLVHVSEIDWKRIDRPSDVLKIGDDVEVLVKEIDHMGRVNLSMKALKPKPEGYVEPPPRPPREDRGPRPHHGPPRRH